MCKYLSSVYWSSVACGLWIYYLLHRIITFFFTFVALYVQNDLLWKRRRRFVVEPFLTQVCNLKAFLKETFYLKNTNSKTLPKVKHTLSKVVKIHCHSLSKDSYLIFIAVLFIFFTWKCISYKHKKVICQIHPMVIIQRIYML